MKEIFSYILNIKILATVLFLVGFHAKGQGQIIEPAPVTGLVERWKNYNLDNNEIRGWRIQLIATVDRRQVESVQRGFDYKYPEYHSHVANNQPYFHLRTGAFLTSQKALAYLKKLQHDYPAAIIVEDMIKNEELLLYDQ